MANLLYLHDDTTTSPQDDTYIGRLSGALGHVITTQQTSTFTTASEALIDVVVIGVSNGGGGTLPADLEATTKPLVVHGAYNWSSAFGFSNSGTLRNGLELDITDNLNVLSAGLPLGTYTHQISSVSIGFLSNPTPQLKVSCVATADVTRVGFCYLNAGDTGQGSLLIASNRVFIPTRDTVDLTQMTASGLLQYDASIAYAVGVATVPKLEGTLTPWNTQTPAANLTGIKYSVRSDLQTSDNQVLSGTTTTNASGQFTIEDAALGPATTYYVTFENAGGTVFATHKITTE
jgi:hypothetical protein